MNQVTTILAAAGVAGALFQPLLAGARQQPPAKSQRIEVCSLLPKEDVKKHIPWTAVLDSMPIEEEPIGPSGSSCNYPSVHIQVLPRSHGILDIARKRGGLETVGGVGEEAYFYNNANRYAELYVRTGKHILTLQADVPDGGNVEATKPGVLSLARALVAKLP